MDIKLIFIFLFASIHHGDSEADLPTTIQIEIFNIGSIKLEEERPNVFSVPPLVILDVDKLSNSSCFINFRTKKHSLGIPIIFWNYSYIDRINEKFTGSQKVSPPNGNVSFQIDWRRSNMSSDRIHLNTTWHRSHINYYLPMSHTFVMEFDSENSSRELCEQTQTKLISEPLQRQELVVRFKKSDEILVKPLQWGIYYSYLTPHSPIKDCGAVQSCFIYQENVEIYSYYVSYYYYKNVYSKMNINLQQQIMKLVQDYLCEKIVFYPNVLKQKLVGSSTAYNNETRLCVVPNELLLYLNNPKDVPNKNILPIESYHATKKYEFEIPIIN